MKIFGRWFIVFIIIIIIIYSENTVAECYTINRDLPNKLHSFYPIDVIYLRSLLLPQCEDFLIHFGYKPHFAPSLCNAMLFFYRDNLEPLYYFINNANSSNFYNDEFYTVGLVLTSMIFLGIFPYK